MRAKTRACAATTTMAAMLACLVVPSTASADEAADQLARGRQLIMDDDYAGALSAFTTSYRLRRKPSTLFNIGMCQKVLYRYVQALETFHHVIEHPSAKTSLRSKARAAVRDLTDLVGRLVLMDAPAGATVRIDNARVGETPIGRTLYVEPGQHVVVVELDGYETLRINVRVASGGQARVQAALELQDMDQDDDGAFESEDMLADVPPEAVVRQSRALLVGSIVVGAAGLGLTILGLVSMSSYNDDFDAIIVASQDGDETDYNRLVSEIEADQLGMTIGYALGGALLATGGIMLALYLQDGDRMAVGPGGVGVRF